MTRVLPVPAPARISRGPAVHFTARCWASFRSKSRKLAIGSRVASWQTSEPASRFPFDFFYFAIARDGFVSFGNCQRRHVRYNQQEQQRKTAMTKGDYILGKKP